METDTGTEGVTTEETSSPAPLVGADGGFSEGFIEKIPEDYRSSFDGISNFNELATEFHNAKNRKASGIADENGNLIENWYDKFDELRDEASMRNFKSIEGLAKSLVNANKLAGKKKQNLDDLIANEDDMKALREKLGVPESPDGYEFTKPEDYPEDMPYDEEQVKWWANIAKEANLTKEQANNLRQKMYDLQRDAFIKSKEAMENERAEAVKALEADWGKEGSPTFNAELANANKAINTLGISKEMEELNLMNNPKFAKVLAKIGLNIGESSLAGVGKTDGGLTKSQIQAEIAKLNIDKAMMNKDHPEHKVKVARLTELFSMLHPEID